MTQDDLNELLLGKNLIDALDVKTLVMDQVRQKNVDELLPLFRAMLPKLTKEQLSGYMYMTRS